MNLIKKNAEKALSKALLLVAKDRARGISGDILKQYDIKNITWTFKNNDVRVEFNKKEDK